LANPQLEDGYTKIANEILEALCRVNLSPYESRVLHYLIRKTYGWEKKEDWISLFQFAEGIGLDRRHAYRAIKSLLNKRMVVICRDDKKHPKYGFQKDYQKWKLSSVEMTKNLNGLANKMIEKRERRKRKSASTDDKIVPVQALTKEIITKETLKEKEERESVSSSLVLSSSLKDEREKICSSKEEPKAKKLLIKERNGTVYEYNPTNGVMVKVR